MRATAAASAAGADEGGFRNMKPAASLHPNARGRELVPATELGERDAEPVCDRNKSVPAPGGIEDSVRCGLCPSGHRHEQRFDAIEL